MLNKKRTKITKKISDLPVELLADIVSFILGNDWVDLTANDLVFIPEIVLANKIFLIACLEYLRRLFVKYDKFIREIASVCCGKDVPAKCLSRQNNIRVQFKKISKDNDKADYEIRIIISKIENVNKLVSGKISSVTYKPFKFNTICTSIIDIANNLNSKKLDNKVIKNITVYFIFIMWVRNWQKCTINCFMADELSEWERIKQKNCKVLSLRIRGIPFIISSIKQQKNKPSSILSHCQLINENNNIYYLKIKFNLGYYPFVEINTSNKKAWEKQIKNIKEIFNNFFKKIQKIKKLDLTLYNQEHLYSYNSYREVNLIKFQLFKNIGLFTELRELKLDISGESNLRKLLANIAKFNKLNSIYFKVEANSNNFKISRESFTKLWSLPRLYCISINIILKKNIDVILGRNVEDMVIVKDRLHDFDSEAKIVKIILSGIPLKCMYPYKKLHINSSTRVNDFFSNNVYLANNQVREMQNYLKWLTDIMINFIDVSDSKNSFMKICAAAFKALKNCQQLQKLKLRFKLYNSFSNENYKSVKDMLVELAGEICKLVSIVEKLQICKIDFYKLISAYMNNFDDAEKMCSSDIKPLASIKKECVVKGRNDKKIVIVAKKHHFFYSIRTSLEENAVIKTKSKFFQINN